MSQLHDYELPGTVVTCLTFSPDRNTLAAGHTEGVVHLWSLGANKEIRTLTASRVPITELAFAPDGSLLATGDAAGRLKLWAPYTGTPVGPLPSIQGRLYSLGFSSDGGRLAAGLLDADGKGEIQWVDLSPLR
jgi:WD40 repeat protein